MFKLPPRRLAVCAAAASGLFAAHSVAEINMPEFYGSLRGHMNMGSSDNKLEEGSSRVGIRFSQEVSPGVTAFARLEKGVSLFDGDKDTFWSRLGFIGVGHETLGSVSFGKQWSVYYDVAGASEQLYVNGGDVTGIYGTLTNSTARSDNAIQYNNQFGGLKLGLQVQNPNEFNSAVGSADLDRAYTGAVRYGFGENIEVGVAHTEAKILSADSSLNLSGDKSQATAASFKGAFGPVDVTVAYSESKNHVKASNGKFYDAKGGEAFAAYNVSPALKYYVGYNRQELDGTQEQINYASVGTNYHWNKNFQTFAEVKFDQGVKFDGTKKDDRLYVGGRFNF